MNDVDPINPDSFIEHLKETAAGIITRQGEVVPMALILAMKNPKTRVSLAKPSIIPVAVAGLDGESADKAVAEIRKLVRKSSAVGVGFMTEAWILQGAPPKNYRYGDVAKSPERQEILMVSWDHRHARPNRGCSRAEILRTDDGTFKSLGPWERNPEEQATGRFAVWLDPSEEN